jgi:hypothetical protein
VRDFLESPTVAPFTKILPFPFPFLGLFRRQIPAADGFAACVEDGGGEVLEADDGAELFLDGEGGEGLAAALFGGEEGG